MAPTDETKDVLIYRCCRCGAEYENPVGHFYMVKYSELYKKNDRYAPLCKECVNELFDVFSRRYHDDKTACILLCHLLDIPFYHTLYDSIVVNNNTFSVGLYLRQINNRQYQNQNFCNTLLSDELGKSDKEVQEITEDKWTKNEKSALKETIEVVGYDPFEEYNSQDRRFLFSELVKYFDDDIADDSYKLSQIIQIVNNNHQIRQCDTRIMQLDPVKDAAAIKDLIGLKQGLVNSNDKIAKENEISVKNRSHKDIGRSTLTYLMKDLREKDFKEAEANYYDQLRSEGTQWAADMSMKAIKQNGFFDENDRGEVFELQREMIQKLQAQVDDLTEEKRLLTIERDELKRGGGQSG